MTEKQPESKRLLARLWDRVVRVDAVLEDEEDRRIGALFNTLMVVAMLQGLALAISLIIARQRGYFPGGTMGAVSALSPFGLLPVSLISYVLVKRGHMRWTIPFYVWINLLVVLIMGLIIGGSSSVGWIMLFWPITLAGTLMRPGDTLRFTLISVVLYIFVAGVQGTGRYMPPLDMPLESTQYLSIAFTWIMLITVGGFVSFLNVSSLNTALRSSREATMLASEVRAELEERVAVRTQTLSHRADQFQTITELAKVTSTVREEQALLETIVNLISERMGFYHVALFNIDHTGEWAILKQASSEGGKRMLARGHRLRVGQQGVVGYVSSTGLPRYAFDVGEDTLWLNNPDLPGTKSEIALPLSSLNGVYGVLDIQTQETAAFDAQDVDVLRALADNIAIAIENTRLLSEMQAALTRLERYQEQDAIRAWKQALARRHMQIGYAYESGSVLPLRTPAVIYDKPGAQDGVVVSQSDSGMHRLTTSVSVGGRPAGYLIFERSTPWSDETIQLVETVVTQLDLALNNARLLEETKLRARHEAARSDVVERVRALTSTDAIMRSAAEALGQAMGVERSRIQLVQGDDAS